MKRLLFVASLGLAAFGQEPSGGRVGFYVLPCVADAAVSCHRISISAEDPTITSFAVTLRYEVNGSATTHTAHVDRAPDLWTTADINIPASKLKAVSVTAQRKVCSASTEDVRPGEMYTNGRSPCR